jgi:cystathionine gamma-lyase / homocysteine desulfhydrase
MKPVTNALHLRTEASGALPAVTPLYQCSAFEAASAYFYTRKNNPNIAEFEGVVAELERAQYSVAVTTGMAALSAVLQLLSPGDELVVNKHIYGCSYKLAQRVMARLRLRLTTLDLSSSEEIERIPNGVRMVLFETPTNPFLNTIDIQAVSEAARSRAADPLVVVDNTWATPLYQHPLEHGADISLHSATKYFSGHSDVMGGILLTNRADLHEELRAHRFYHGSILDPHSAWLLRRSMQTFSLRMEHHYRAAKWVADFLAPLPQVAKVYYPAIDGRQLTGYGALFFFELRKELVPRYKQFTSELKLFGTGTGMACVTSMVAQPYTGSHASMTPPEKAAMGLDESLVRLSVGLENVDDLTSDLANALSAIELPRTRAAAAGGFRP